MVLASAGYPGSYQSGVPIKGLDQLDTSNQLQVFHAGTAKSEAGEFLTAGGRVLGITAAGSTLDQALASCYRAVAAVNWEGMQYRRDIGRFGSSSQSGSSPTVRRAFNAGYALPYGRATAPVILRFTLPVVF